MWIEFRSIANLTVALRDVSEWQPGSCSLRGIPGIQHVIPCGIAELQVGTRGRTAHRNTQYAIRTGRDGRDAIRLATRNVNRSPGLIIVDGGDGPSSRDI